MDKNHKKDVDSMKDFIIKTAKDILKFDKIWKDVKFMVGKRKPTKRKRAKKKPAKRKHIPKAVRDAVMERDNYTCVYCASTNNPELDHDEARANGGSDDDDNLQVLCRSCNRRKGAS